MSGARIVTVVPAAGLGRRMGACKALLELERRTFLAWIVSSYRHLPDWGLVVVIRRGDVASGGEAGRLGALVVENANLRAEMLDSIRRGLEVVGGDCQAVFVHPVDVPLAGPETAGLLLAALERPGIEAAVPEHAGRTGHPVLLSRSLVRRIAARELPAGSSGLRSVLAELGPAVARVPVAWRGVLQDCDQVVDLPVLGALARELAHGSE